MTDDAHAHESVDGWLTIAPQPGIVDEHAQDRNGHHPVFDAPERLARSPLVFVIWKDRLEVLASDQACGSTGIDWRCLGSLVDTPWSAIGGPSDWNNVAVGHADPKADTVGLLALGQEAHEQARSRRPRP